MNGYDTYQMFELQQQDRQREADMERLSVLAQRLDNQKRSTGLLNAVLNAAKARAQADNVREIVPVTVFAAD
ncbi:MAG: hypothetical protein IPK19_29050 [Chloroflexi bacterium]|nr:hypothetical protein [Chloroflexota bacterium]